MNSASPVIDGLEPYEVKIGGAEQGQPEYSTLHSLRSPDGKVMSRWQLTPEERAAIAAGADIFLTIWTFNNPYPPTSIQVLSVQSSPDYFRETMALDDELALRIMRDDVQRLYGDLKQLAAAADTKKKEYDTKAQQVLARINGSENAEEKR